MMDDDLRVDVGPMAASIAELVIDTVETATKYGRDWRPTMAELVQLRLERLWRGQFPEAAPRREQLKRDS